MTMPNDTITNQSGREQPRSIGPTQTPIPRAPAARAQIRDVKNQVVDHAKESFRQARDSAGSSLNEQSPAGGRPHRRVRQRRAGDE